MTNVPLNDIELFVIISALKELRTNHMGERLAVRDLVKKLESIK